MTTKRRTYSGGAYTEAVNLTGLVCTRQPAAYDAVVTDPDTGAIIDITDVFYFEKQSDGTLPAIVAKDVITDSDSNRFEILTEPENQGGELNRLKCSARRLKVAVSA